MCQVLEDGAQNISAETKADIRKELYNTESYTIKCVETYVTEIDTALIQQEFMGFVKMLIPMGMCTVQILHYPGII
jgi:hypothetical protein